MTATRLGGNRGPLRFSAFVPASEVSRLFANEEGRDEALRLFRANRITKVYLDCLRGGHFPGEAVLEPTIRFFRDAGLDVAAGLTPTRGTGKGSTHGRHWLCYTNAATQAELEAIVRRTARLFDEMIVDDFLCTHCQCEECRDAKGDRDWGAYYRDLLADVAAERIIRPAKEENPDVHVVIKYPQWYDRFHVFGYDVRRHPHQFDEVWAGTEIRDPLVEYVHQYQAYANYRWLASLSGDRMGGAWFDFINCYPEIYVEQAVQSILAGARELIRFHYGPELFSPENPCTRALLDAIPSLERLAAELDGREPEGIAFYKPPDTDGENEAYLLDYLGMLGLPLVPRHTFPTESSAVCLPVQAAADRDIASKLLAFLENGGTALLTPGFLGALASDTRMLAAAGYGAPPVTPADLWTFRFAVEGASAAAEAHVHFGAQLHPVEAETLASAVHPSGNVPVLTRRKIGEGTVLVLNATTFRYPPGSGRVTVGEPVSLPHLPALLVDRLRAELLAGLPIDVEVRSRVGVYVFPERLVLTNFNDQAVTATVRIAGHPDGSASDLATGDAVGEWISGTLACEVPRRGVRLLAR